MAVSDYVGRRMDVLAFRGARPSGEATMDMSLLDDESGGELCVGVQKLAQAWLLAFLKEKGSVPHFPDEGCAFMIAVKQGRIRTELDVFQQFNLSSGSVQRDLVNLEDGTEPDDERFSGARLDHVVVTPGFAELHVTVASRAGTTRKVILPISTIP